MTASKPAASELSEQARTATTEWLEAKKPATRTAYAAELRRYEAYLEQSCTPAFESRAADAERYLAHRRRAAPAASSLARSLAALGSWYEHMIGAGLTASNPFEGIERPSPDEQESATRVLTEPETQLLAHAAEHQPRRHGGRDTRTRDALALLLLLRLGIRAPDLFALRIGHLTRQDGQWTIVVPGGHDEPRAKPIGEELERALIRHLAHRLGRTIADAEERTLEHLLGRFGPQDLLVTTESGSALDRPALTRSLRRLAAVAGIERPQQVTPQALRLTFAATAAGRGVDRSTLQRELGHADWRTTHRTLRRAARARPPKDPPA